VKVWGIVPVKNLTRAKSRLAPALGPAERQRFSWERLARTLQLLQKVPVVDTIVVVSGDPAALELAVQYHVQPLMEDSPAGLNPALTQASVAAVQAGAEALLIVPIDLPLARPVDIEAALNLASSPLPAVVVAPDRAGTGTNLLVLRPPEAIPFAFGPGSLEQHRTASLARGLPFHTVHNPRLALDVDTPADLASLLQHQSSLG